MNKRKFLIFISLILAVVVLSWGIDQGWAQSTNGNKYRGGKLTAAEQKAAAKRAKDLGLKEPYRGIVKLHTGEIAEDIAYYFLESEQIPSAVGLGVFVEPDGKVSAGGGFLIQTIPPVEEGLVDRIVKNIQGIPFITQMIREGKTPEDMLARIFSDIPYHVLGKQELSFRCTCSKERVERALIALGSDELKKFIAEQKETDVTCEYCRTNYRFVRKELEDLRQHASPS